MESQEILEKICKKHHLGELVCEPVSLKGGFMHKMFSLFTSKGEYAVKLLNPYIMKREDALQNFRIAEGLELMLEQNNIPIIPALIFDGKKMQNISGQFYYLYEWFDGKALKDEEINEFHCQKIGKLLAQIHKIDRKELKDNMGEINVDWDYYIKMLESKNKELFNMLKENRTLLYESQNNGNIAIKKLPSVLSVCHNDMDSKNVLWSEMECKVIDLECLDYSNPFMEMYELALCWSGYENCEIDYILFSTFIHSYAVAGGQLPRDWENVYYSNYGRLEWLEYNLKRSLGLECSEEEIEIGIEQVKETMAHVIFYNDIKDDILNCLKQFEV